MEQFILETLRGQWLLDFFNEYIETLAPHLLALAYFGIALFAVIGIFSLIIGLIKLMRR